MRVDNLKKDFVIANLVAQNAELKLEILRMKRALELPVDIHTRKAAFHKGHENSKNNKNFLQEN